MVLQCRSTPNASKIGEIVEKNFKNLVDLTWNDPPPILLRMSGHRARPVAMGGHLGAVPPQIICVPPQIEWAGSVPAQSIEFNHRIRIFLLEQLP